MLMREIRLTSHLIYNLINTLTVEMEAVNNSEK